ncbi:hypothetical protein JIG36_08655 [Actinoplanes sp. LDG1-06]|uniref:Uncharacterized protein n=1 Tax=Paractinoplanes ovalisporus TaxID=2810368 RepID=A0ABS2A774_9ACTN|nr:hypothetical protein [Actinoplanes ovalisporus]MBM2615632.1 hypothetical protein [Actinoplanes ovalisporus]
MKRAAVLVLAVSAAVVGVWAAAFPVSFYNDFPAPGRHWVSTLGPYSEHLVRDVGALYLALLVLSVWAWRRPSPDAYRVTGGAWLIFNSIHFLWHMLHLEMFPTIDKVGNAVALGGVLILSILLLLPDGAGADRRQPGRAAADPGEQ